MNVNLYEYIKHYYPYFPVFLNDLVCWFRKEDRTNEMRAKMERLTHEADFGLEEWEQTLYSVKSDPGGAYNILDIASHAGEGEFDEILKTISLGLKHYEDTGLTPEQTRGLKERDTAKAPEPTPLGMVCPTCGEKAFPWDRFCGECGQRLWEE